MPDQPTELPYWNPPEDPEDVKNPGLAQADLGYKYYDIVPYGWINWQWKRTYQWLLYLKEFVDNAFAVQHDPDTGFHTNVTALTLEVSDAGDQWVAFGPDGFAVKEGDTIFISTSIDSCSFTFMKKNLFTCKKEH